MTAIGEITRTCPDCGAVVGKPHEDGCDVARCLATGMQRLQCSEDEHCGQDIWTGLWPGEAECIEFGWFAYFRAPRSGERSGAWEPCGKDHPDAVPDLNRLLLECCWDQTWNRWLRRTP